LTTLHMVHDLDGNVIAEYNASGTLVTEYISVDGRPLAMVDNTGTTPALYYVLTDHLERPIMMADESRNIVWQASYLPFGEVRTISGSAVLNQRFPGQWFQIETGLSYNWHRHYDPSIGRYLQPDPLGMPDGPSRYAYVSNSPLMYVDPTGLARKKPTFTCEVCDAPHGGVNCAEICWQCWNKGFRPQTYELPTPGPKLLDQD